MSRVCLHVCVWKCDRAVGLCIFFFMEIATNGWLTVMCIVLINKVTLT